MFKKITKLTDAVPLKTMQRIQDNFSEGLGISMIIYDTKCRKITRLSKPNKFWQEFIQKKPNVFNTFDKNLKRAIQESVHKNEPLVISCYCSTEIFTVPINISGKIVAIFVCGRIRTGNPNLKECRTESEKLQVDPDDFLEAYLELPFLNNHTIQAITKLLNTTANTISMLSLAGTESKEKLAEASYLNKLLEEEIEVRNMALTKSEKKYRSIIENAIDVICTIDSEGIITSINEMGAKMIKKSKEEIIGTHFANYAHKDSIKKLENAVEEIKKGENDTITNLQYRGAVSNHLFSINAKAIKNNKGEILEIECIIRDITKQKELEIKLEEANEKYHKLINSVPDGIYACNFKDGKFTAINKAACEMFGYKEKELLEKHVQDVYVNPEERKDFIKEISKNSQYHGFVAHVKHKNGKSFYIETYSNLIKDKNGNPISIEGVFRDITSKIKISNQLRKSENKFKAIFDHSFIAIILTDKNGEIIETNHKAKSFFGINLRNIQEIFKNDTKLLLENAKRKGTIQTSYFPSEIRDKTQQMTAIISKIQLDPDPIFQIIFHNLDKFPRTQGSLKASSIKASQKV